MPKIQPILTYSLGSFICLDQMLQLTHSIYFIWPIELN